MAWCWKPCPLLAMKLVILFALKPAMLLKRTEQTSKILSLSGKNKHNWKSSLEMIAAKTTTENSH